MYGNEFKRIKDGELQVDILCSLNKEKLKEIEQFRNEHPNTSTEWFDHRFNEKISLNEVVELLDGIPDLSEHLTVLDAGEIIYDTIGKDLIQCFKNAIVEQVSCEISEQGPLFLKKDVIGWMAKKAATDNMFIYRLNTDFVKDYMQLHANYVTKNEIITKEAFFKSLAKDILEDIKSIKLEGMLNMPFIIRSCLSFCGFELNKNKKTYDKNGKLIHGLSRDTLRGYLKCINVPLLKQGNLSKTYKTNIEKWLDWLKRERFDSDKYKIHKARLNKLIKDGAFN